MGGAGGVHAARLCQFLELLLSCEPSGLLPSRGRGLPSHPGCPPALRAGAGRQGEGLWELGSRASRPSSLSLPPWLICTLPLPAPPTGCLASGGQCPPAGPCLLLVTQGKIQPRHACYVALICPCPTWSHLRPRRVATPQGFHVPAQSQQGCPHKASPHRPRVPALPCHLCCLLITTQECVGGTWGHPTPLLTQAPPLISTPDRPRPAHSPLLGVQIHLFTSGPPPGMEVHLIPTHLPPTCPHIPSLPPSSSASSFWKSLSLCACGGGGGEGFLSSALQVPGHLLQDSVEWGAVGGPGAFQTARESLEPVAACPVGQNKLWVWAGRAPKVQAPALAPHPPPG